MAQRKEAALPRFFSGGEKPKVYQEREKMTTEEIQTEEGKQKRKELLQQSIQERKGDLTKREMTEGQQEYYDAFLKNPRDRYSNVVNVLRVAKEFRRSHTALMNAEDSTDKDKWLEIHASKRRLLSEHKEYGGPQLELAIIEYFEKVADLAEWERARTRVREITHIITERKQGIIQQTIKEGEGGAGKRTSLYHERKIAAARIALDKQDLKASIDDKLDTLYAIYGEDSKEVHDYLGRIQQDTASEERSITELEQERADLEEDIEVKWQESAIIRELYTTKARLDLIRAVDRGEEVLETDSTIQVLNFLHRIEAHHKNTTIGGIFVGPPGTGKTTAIKKYLRDKGREFAQIDISGEVSRFSLFGSKSLETKGHLENVMEMLSVLNNMSEEEVQALTMKELESNPEFIKNLLNNLEELQEQTEQESDPVFSLEDNDIIQQVRELFSEQISEVKVREFHAKMKKLGKENGWRYGVAIDALRKGKSLILDEFNKAKDLTLFHSLMTAEPASDEEAGINPNERFKKEGKNEKASEQFNKLSKEISEMMFARDQLQEGSNAIRELDAQITSKQSEIKKSFKGWWFFADNKEWIRVQENWRMYFTANIGRRYKTEKISPAIASRVGGKVMEIGYKSPVEELRIMDAYLSYNDGMGARVDSENGYDDRDKVTIFIGYAVPAIRKMLNNESKLPTIPVSLRTLKDLSTDLFDRETLTVRDTTFDSAVWWHLVQPYVLYENQEIPKAITEILLQHGFFLDENSIKETIIENGWKTEGELEDYRSAFEKNEEELLEASSKLSSQSMVALVSPDQLKAF